jgi:hypothetical protein
MVPPHPALPRAGGRENPEQFHSGVNSQLLSQTSIFCSSIPRFLLPPPGAGDGWGEGDPSQNVSGISDKCAVLCPRNQANRNRNTGATQEPRALWFPLTLPSPAPGGGKARSNSTVALIPNFYLKLQYSAVQHSSLDIAIPLSLIISSLPPARGRVGVRGILAECIWHFR